MKKVKEEINPSKNTTHSRKNAGKTSDIARSLVLVTQLGISMLVPIFLCIGIGICLDQTFDTSLTLLFLILGFLAGGRNVWILAKQEAEKQSRHVRRRNQYDLMKGGKEDERSE